MKDWWLRESWRTISKTSNESTHKYRVTVTAKFYVDVDGWEYSQIWGALMFIYHEKCFEIVPFVFLITHTLSNKEFGNTSSLDRTNREKLTQFLTFAEYSFESPLQKKENDGTGAWKRFLALYVISFRDDSWDSGAGVFTPVVPSVCTKVILGGSEAGARIFFPYFFSLFYILHSKVSWFWHVRPWLDTL